ncbi:sulfite exporter TauE/SafE family protein [Amaricoccus solimangrovi]|uniref:Probable membrane transporter protein n=1 Tax=Amaricoccus solimangrovi TaxID=2589815 RepID=A0A501WY87_9RHOB|nr:sulfite exporter TauE/SafE family protein [Amaricoccus solimangrovi]TPE53520.1 sulfite exporter TauE/SafE family protein [Amaricoccus solimangrovi]
MPDADPTHLVTLAGLLLAIGGLSGIIAGMLGVGGGIVLVPAFLYTFDILGYASPYLMQVCLATSLATIAVTSGRSVRGHMAKGAVDRDILRGWAPFIALGAVIGVVVAGGMKSTVLMLTFGVLGTLIGLYIAFGRDDWRLGDHMPTRWGRWITGTVIGFLSVLMGIGGGSFGVPLMRLYNVPIHRAVGTASGFGMVIAIPSVLGFLLSGWGLGGLPAGTVGLVNLPAFAIVVATTMITTPWGVALAHAMDPKPLKRIFGGFLIVVALNMLRKALMG